MRSVARGPLTILIASLLALVLAGCAPRLGDTGPTLHVTRTGYFSLLPLDVTVTNPTQVRRLFDVALALRQVPKGAIFHCPIDFGTRYHLTFTAHDSPPVHMTLDASGCRFLVVEPSGPSYFQTNDFRALFSDVTGITPIEPRLPPG